MNTCFDELAASYGDELKQSLGAFGNRDVSMFASYKIKIVASKLSRLPTEILEFGCGAGRNIPFLRDYFPESNIYACDISDKSLEVARKLDDSARFDRIDYPDDLLRIYKNTFDCIFISNVFHHIPFEEHSYWLDVLYKLLSPNGSIFIFEHNPYNPLTKRIFNNSAIDKGAAMLSPSYCYGLLRKKPFSALRRNYTFFFLHRNRFFEYVERLLVWLPFGAQYYVWGRK